MRAAVVALLGGFLLSGPWSAQAPDLSTAGEAARSAWVAHQVDGLVGSTPRLLIRLPGADPSAPVGRSQAVALLRDYLRGFEEVETTVRETRVVDPGRGFVELRRRYRVAGTQEIREQALLLSYELGGAGWVLTELRISG
ncbi:MAG: hypothetical protein ACREMO_08400 [Gemmatimonadales bacterium]